jgi:hypothetical protein
MTESVPSRDRTTENFSARDRAAENKPGVTLRPKEGEVPLQSSTRRVSFESSNQSRPMSREGFAEDLPRRGHVPSPSKQGPDVRYEPFSCSH